MEVGDIYKTNNYGELIITEIINCKNIYVEFIQTKFKAKFTKVNIEKGEVRDLLYPKVYGVGYIGVGSYRSKHRSYMAWHNMLARCYSEEYQRRYPTYNGVFVAEEWHNFQNFAKWYDNEIINLCRCCTYHVDKDLSKQKFYSEDTCNLLPQEINNLFVYRDKKRGEYLIGVSLIKSTGQFRSSSSCGRASKNLGHFSTENSAYEAYKAYKENLISEKAKKAYSENKISEKAYNSLMQYEVTKDL